MWGFGVFTPRWEYFNGSCFERLENSGSTGFVNPGEVVFIMNGVKVSWVGQTFALARCSDSGGRKSRIRRSKEERKDMVESFIKKYQKTNNGSFPSLNLTHKEVGGSFYTVREIVREIIQENRVLGPAMLTSEEISTEQFSEHYPLGSISIESQSQLSMSSSGSCVTDFHQSIYKEPVSTSSGQSNGYSRQTSDNGKYISGMLVDGEYEESNTGKPLENGSVAAQVDDKTVFSKVQVSETSSGQSAGHSKQTTNNGIYINGICMGEEYKESNAEKPLEEGSVTTQVDTEPIFVEGQVCEKLDGVEDAKEAICKNLGEVENVKEAPIAKVTPIAAGVIVETFPLKSAVKPIHGTDWMSGESRDVTKSLKEQETKKVDVATENADLLFHRIDSLEEISHGLVDEKEAVNIAEPFQENLSFSATQNSSRSSTLLDGTQIAVEVSRNDFSTLQTADPNKMVIGIEPKLVPPEGHSKNVTASGNTSTSGDSLSQELTSQAKADIEHNQSTGEGSNTSLNTLNLDSREGGSKKSVKAEINPFWTVFRAFVSSFVKFWTE
ncbi:hypothetical protein NE237_010298 [Protea cynaroides]|uniref:AT3G52170-like helix-turn-helix domain-containing protein n=1 Tax=Protea cynaroides TaxID=273540 RepID=A0A9Q0KZB4_9MAGN|nr:hypothetical protein NE237_010298 [Protea cynaroides]